MASAGDLKKVGRVGLKSVVYFEFMTTIALVIGAMLAYATRPGAGMNIDLHTLDAASLATYTEHAKSLKDTAGFLLKIIPDTADRRLREGRHPAGARVLGAVRRGAVAARREGAARDRPDR